MAIRQYIGARYVPRFLGTYDITQQYDALDVVDNGSGTSYIARKTVPAGTALINTEYWFVYGASSGAIYDLQTRMGDAENDIDDLQGDMATALSDIANLSANLELLKYGDIICVSDSYGHYPSTSDNWIDILDSHIPNTVYKAEVGGASFGGTIPFTSVIQGIESDVTHPEKVGAIIVAGGYNDTDHVSDILTGIQSFMSYVNSQYPNAKVYLFYVALTDEASRNFKNRTEVLPAYKNYATQIAGISYVYGSEYINIDYHHLDSGGVHPAHVGALDIAAGVQNFLASHTTGFRDGMGKWDQTIQSSGAHNTPYTDKILRCYNLGNMTEVMVATSFTLEYDSAQTPGWNEIGTISTKGFMNGTLKEYCSATLPCSITVGGVVKPASGLIAFENKKVYFKVGSTDNYTRLVIPGNAFSIPTLWC